MSSTKIKVAKKLNIHDKNRSVRSKLKKSVPKPVLCTPYKISWPQVEQKVQEDILNKLEKFFSCDVFKKSEEKKLDIKSRKDRKKMLKKEFKMHNIYRKPLAIGLQEVTKHAERNNLSLIIVDRSSPWQLHRHLIQLSRVRNCSAIALDQFSDKISPLLSMLRICALGFKKDHGDIPVPNSDMFDKLVAEISPLCPECELPWLDCEEELMAIKNEGKFATDRTANDEDNKLLNIKIKENITARSEETDTDGSSEESDDDEEDDEHGDEDKHDNGDDAEEMDFNKFEEDDDDENDTADDKEFESSSDFANLYVYKNKASKLNDDWDEDSSAAVIIEKCIDIWDYKIIRSNILSSKNTASINKSFNSNDTVNLSKSSNVRKRKFQDTVVAKIHKNEFKTKKIK